MKNIALLLLTAAAAFAQSGPSPWVMPPGPSSSPFVGYIGDCRKDTTAPAVISCQTQFQCLNKPGRDGSYQLTKWTVTAISSCVYPPTWNPMYVRTWWDLPTWQYTVQSDGVVYKNFYNGVAAESYGYYQCSFTNLVPIVLINTGSSTICI